MKTLARLERSERIRLGLALAAAAFAGLSTLSAAAAEDAFEALLRKSFRDRGARHVEEIVQQDAVQRACSAPVPPSGEVLARLQAEQAATVVFPQDGRFLGDWKRGEALAQDGRGRQFSDPPDRPSGGNCYACHQLRSDEPNHGTLGPSLLGYGRRHGATPDALRAAWAQLWNPRGSQLCSAMPRFGAHGLLSEDQLRDLMALLFDPASPVNR